MTSWPTSIPLPFVDFSGSSRTTTLQSSAEQGLFVRRNRYNPSYRSLTVAWVLSVTNYAAFQEFFFTTLSDGCAMFSLELRYPKNSALTEWVVRFLAGFEARCEDGIWIVQAELDLVRELAVSEFVLRDNFIPFAVVSETETGEVQHFTVASGQLFYVEAP